MWPQTLFHQTSSLPPPPRANPHGSCHCLSQPATPLHHVLLLLAHAKSTGQTSVCRGFGVVKAPRYQTQLAQGVRVCTSTQGHRCDVQTGARREEGKQRSHAIEQGQATPAPTPSPSTGLKIEVIRFQRGKEMKRSSVTTFRHALRLLFSPRGSPSLGLPLAFPEQKRLGCTPWARPSAVASGRGVLPFYPSLSAFLPPMTGSFLAWGKGPVGAQGSIPVA